MKTLIKVYLAILILGPGTSQAAARFNTERPNIIIILADDLGYSDIGCMGSEIHTPNLDMLANKGILFTQMHNTSKCFPTRASLLSGVYFQQTDRQFQNTVLIGEILKENGYVTLWSGKHHSDFDPRTRGFDRFYGFLGGAINYINPGNAAVPGGKMPAFIKGEGYKWILDNEGSRRPFIPDNPGYYSTDAFTDYAIKWIDEYSKEDKPFFLYLAYNAPHWPLHAKEEDIEKYKDYYHDGYEAVRNRRYERQIELGILNRETSPLSKPEYENDWEALSDSSKEGEILRMQVYAAMIDRLDQNIGRLIAGLKRENKLDNTVIFFLSDNGGCAENPDKRVQYPDNTPGKTGEVDSYEAIRKSWATVANTPLRYYKTDSYAGGIRTPMIVWCGKNINTIPHTSDESLHLIDMLPTIMALTSSKSHNHSDYLSGLPGIDFSASLSGKKIERTGPLYFQFNKGNAIIEDDWKLVKRGNDDWELFNLKVDRTETKNLAASEPEKFKELLIKWEDWYNNFK